MASGSIGEPNQDQAASPEQKAITEGGRTSMFWPGRESEAPLSTRSKTPTEDHLSFRKLPELPGEIRRSEVGWLAAIAESPMALTTAASNNSAATGQIRSRILLFR